MLGETLSDDRMDRKALVVGVAIGGSTKAYPFDLLSGMLVISDSLGGGEVLVYLESDTDTALVYDREVDGRVLTFSTAEDGLMGRSLFLWTLRPAPGGLPYLAKPLTAHWRVGSLTGPCPTSHSGSHGKIVTPILGSTEESVEARGLQRCGAHRLPA